MADLSANPDATETAPSTNSRFLSLPPELRTIIYDYCYPDILTDIELSRARDLAPSRSLEQVCHLIRHEVKEERYERCINGFWGETTFTLRLLPRETSAQATFDIIDGLGLEIISRISRILITTTVKDLDSLTLEVTPATEGSTLAWDVAQKKTDEIPATSTRSVKYFLSNMRRRRWSRFESHVSPAKPEAMAHARLTVKRFESNVEEGEMAASLRQHHEYATARDLLRVDRERRMRAEGWRKKVELEKIVKSCLRV